MADNRMNAMTRTAEQGLSEIAALINRREYNLSLIRTRQFMEQVVKGYADREGVGSNKLADTIEELYKFKVINRSSRDAFHSIRILGNRAVYDGDNDPRDAQDAYYYLKEQFEVFFAYLSRPQRAADRTPVNISAEDQPYSQSARRRSEEYDQDNTQMRAPNREDRLRAKREAQNQQNRGGGGFSLQSLLIILVLLICIVLVIVILKNILGSRKTEAPVETTTAEVTETAATEPETTEPPATEPETTTAAPVRYRVTGDTVNVRFVDDSDRIYTKLSKGYEIGPIEEIEGSDFVKFSLDGGTYLISKKYIEPIT